MPDSKAVAKKTVDLPAEFVADLDKDLESDLAQGDLTSQDRDRSPGQVFNVPGLPDPVRRFRAVYFGSHRFNVWWRRNPKKVRRSAPDCLLRMP